ncbi:MAG: glycoside hydrolase family 92 protein [Clostridiales bacterium]|nr:glycoside hydrolase family 92 protein [Clostridiales bacterium]
MGGRKEQETYPFKGYVSNATSAGLSWSMENYTNDFGAAQLAAALGRTDEAVYYRNRVLHYPTLYNEEAGGFFISKNQQGSFRDISNYNPADRWGD